ncbi:MAG: GNAT family N-acetyltransferase [Anaerolineaceae bacterium]|nr:GNAT family N-acetyltransferase [Anaerolineaceae bacterium]
MGISSRPYRPDDFLKIRDFLSETYQMNGRLHNWGIERWNIFPFGTRKKEEIAGKRLWEQDICIWEDAGKMVAVVHPENPNDYYFQIHPGYRNFEEQMIIWAEEHHKRKQIQKGENTPLEFQVFENDSYRMDLLGSRGYVQGDWCGVSRGCDLDSVSTEYQLAEGYKIKNMKEMNDFIAKAALLNLAFDSTSNSEATAALLLNAPDYHPEMDFIAVAPDGAMAAFVLVWFDSRNGYGMFEPVGTHPQHRRKGLANALLLHGLQKLKNLGANWASLGTGTGEAANRLYEKAGFTHSVREFSWKKQ